MTALSPACSRQRLPNRRKCKSFEFRHAGLDFTLAAGFYPDGRIAEIFLVIAQAGIADRSHRTRRGGHRVDRASIWHRSTPM